MTDTKNATYGTPVLKSKLSVTPRPKNRSVKAVLRETTPAPSDVDYLPAMQVSYSVAEERQVLYVRSKGIDDFVANIHAADAIQLIEIERKGVAGVFVKDLSRRMEIPAQRMFDILGVAKATAEKKVAAGELLTGNGGRAALGLARLLGIANEIVDNSTAADAKNFDSAKWLGQWLETSQPALGGRKPASLIDTPTGLGVVVKLLGAIESGAYQ
ncbi:MAG: antitoxin Xre/MbcA/ParS toxin-binding domain-containing protein [Betaproteobacteria bacterium]